MESVQEGLPDLLDELIFDKPTPDSVDTLLAMGVVVTDPVVSAEELQGVRSTVTTLFLESLHRRLFYKVLESAPSARVRDWAHHRHSRTSQFDPNNIPERLASSAPAIDKVRLLDAEFFQDERLQEMYANRSARLNIADVSLAFPWQPSFIGHSDSVNVVRLGHIIQPVDTLWRIHALEGVSHQDYDYVFTAPEGSVVTTLERAGERPKVVPVGQGFDVHLPDTSEIHSGEVTANRMRHRLGVFAQEDVHAPDVFESLRDRAVSSVVSRIFPD